MKKNISHISKNETEVSIALGICWRCTKCKKVYESLNRYGSKHAPHQVDGICSNCHIEKAAYEFQIYLNELGRDT